MKAVPQEIIRSNGRREMATYVRHLRTLTPRSNDTGCASTDVELYRLADGTEIECLSSSIDGRDTPCERRG